MSPKRPAAINLSKCTPGKGKHHTFQSLGHKVQVDIDIWRPKVPLCPPC